jgi:GNAT superfamily N-acetyltransferase
MKREIMYEIKLVGKNELQQALDLVWTVFQEFEGSDYSQAGIDQFYSFIQVDSISKMINAGEFKIWGCFRGTQIIGVIATRNTNHISLMFVDKAYHRQGIATRLFYIVLEDCIKNKQNFIEVNSSPYACEFYHALEFEDTGREKTVNSIRFTPMKYKI